MASSKLYVMLTIITLIIMIMAGCGGAQSRLNIGDKAPDFTLPSIDGKNISLSDFKGKRVIINTWSTKCVECKKEMPFIQEINDKYSNQDLVVLSINTLDSAKVAKEFVTNNGYTFPVLLDPQWEIYKKFCCPKTGDPNSFFINADGVLKKVKFGSFQSKEEIEDILKSL